MALDFGMKYTKKSGFWTPEGLLTVTGAGGYRIEVAEESLGLLEPRVGDFLVVDGNKLQGVWDEGMRLTIKHNWRVNHPNIGIKIIERGGIPFHWPEQEKEAA